MKIREIMSTDVRTTTPQSPLKECLEILMKLRLNGLVVMEGDRIAGVVTKADIFRAILPTPTDIAEDELYMKDPEYTEERIFKCLDKSAGEIMGKPAITLDADVPIVKAGTTMILNKIKQVPVVDKDRLAGIVTLSDILGFLLKKTNGWGGGFLR
ncbi:MAG TPA: CBS domain-containing protein [Geobacteraceae bacterium]